MHGEQIQGDPQVNKRYEGLRAIGKTILGSETIREGTITNEDVGRARKFVSEGIRETNPPVRASYFEHLFLAPAIGMQIAEQLAGININPDEIEFLLWNHDIGRLVTPGDYLRTDLVGDRLLVASSVPRKLIKKLPSVGLLLEKAEALELDETQLRFQQPLTDDQKQIANAYFESLTPTQRIINFADNLGKRGPNGLFTTKSFLEYLKAQEGRYTTFSQWASVLWAIPRREAGAVLQAYTIEKTAQWLSDLGVNLAGIHRQLHDYGPKLVVVIRHGEVDNPSDFVYTRDASMGEDIIHLNEAGKEQMRKVGTLLTDRGFNVNTIFVSPETRGEESSDALNYELRVSASSIIVTPDLDEVYAPGPFIEKPKMREFANIGGDVYTNERWERYGHEKPQQIIERMRNVFWQSANALSVGQTGVLISHGDPIAWLVNTISGEEVPQPINLRNLVYPAKGEGIAFIVGPDNKVFSFYSLGTEDH